MPAGLAADRVVPTPAQTPLAWSPASAREFVGYLLASALALGVDTAVYAGAMRLAGVGYAGAAAAGFLAGLAVVYTLSVRRVFRSRRLDDRRAEFALFAAIGVLGLLLTEVLLWLLIGGLGVDAVLAKLLAAGAVFVFNFTVRRALLFSRRPRGDSHA